MLSHQTISARTVFFLNLQFWVFRTYIRFPNCEFWCLFNKSSLCC